jgi:hypothetical protein
VPFRRLRLLIVAVFFLFAVVGFFGDFMADGHWPYQVVLMNVLYSGGMGTLWIVVLARLPVYGFYLLIVVQFATAMVIGSASQAMARHFQLGRMETSAGVHFAAIGTFACVMISYIFFISYIRSQGRETFRIQGELELAHAIQKTLVPIVSLRTNSFEVYGISEPSEKVGGDLVDAVCLTSGDAVAYVADVAGHGLPAGILMGMLKTAARTALLDAGAGESNATLPTLLERLNRVLPDVKEPHMYATFTGFRLNDNGSVFYALAASPPILHWSKTNGALRRTEEEQFPLGLLPISGFTGNSLETVPGDLLMVATDGIFEVCNRREQEFGIEALEALVSEHAAKPLPELAQVILNTVRGYGRQADDQTLLLVRRL